MVAPQSQEMAVDMHPKEDRKMSHEDVFPSIEVEDSDPFLKVKIDSSKQRTVRRDDRNLKKPVVGSNTHQKKGDDNETAEKADRETIDLFEDASARHRRRNMQQGIIHTGEYDESEMNCEDRAAGSEGEDLNDFVNSEYERDDDEKASSVDSTPGNRSRPPSSYATPHRAAAKRRPNWHSPQSLAKEKVRREIDINSQTIGWPQADLKLFRALELRGLQPIISTAWLNDFPALPLALFTADEDRTLVNALGLRKNYSGDVHGARALMDLMIIGHQVRDRISDLQQSPAEIYIKKAIDKYIRWTLNDADIWRRRPYLPVMAVVVASKNTSPLTLHRRLLRKMQKLKRKWLDALGGLANACCPPLYGVMVCHSVGAILAPENVEEFGEDNDGGTDGNKNSIRLLSTMDWSEDGQDVWNAFALAMLGVHCRDVLLRALKGRVLRGVKIDGVEDGDPDA